MLVVLGTRTAFGVILHAESRQPAVAEALDRAVVEVALGHVEVADGYRPGVDLELVVLARYVHPPGIEVLDRVIGAVMSVGQA